MSGVQVTSILQKPSSVCAESGHETYEDRDRALVEFSQIESQLYWIIGRVKDEERVAGVALRSLSSRRI